MAAKRVTITRVVSGDIVMIAGRYNEEITVVVPEKKKDEEFPRAAGRDRGSVAESFPDLNVWMEIRKVKEQINANAA